MKNIKVRALVSLLKWFARVKPPTRLRIGAVLGWLAPRLARSRARIVRRNLELCFPEQPESVREQWVADHFRALAQSIVDRGVLWYGTVESINDMVTVTGADHVNALIAQGRSVLLLAPHFIAMDVGGSSLTMVIPSAATMYTPQNDPEFEAVVATGRSRFNDVHLVSRKGGVRDLIRHLRAPRPVYYLPDMDFGSQGSVFVPFFGVPAATLVATAQLAQKWNAVVLPVLCFWNPDTGHYTVDVLPQLEDFPGEDSLEAATARLNRELESWVRRCPSQYYWVHRRFKTRPPGEPKLY